MDAAEKFCAMCGKNFSPNKRGRASKYCSMKCAKEAKQILRLEQLSMQRRKVKGMEKYYNQDRTEFNEIVKKSRETGISYGRLKKLWHDKSKLEAYIAYYRIR